MFIYREKERKKVIIHCFSDYYDESYGIRGHDCRVHDDMTRIAPDVPARPFPVVVLHPIKHGTTKFLLLFTRWLSITLFLQELSFGS